jgi:hypothetical protein
MVPEDTGSEWAAVSGSLRFRKPPAITPMAAIKPMNRPKLGPAL